MSKNKIIAIITALDGAMEPEYSFGVFTRHGDLMAELENGEEETIWEDYWKINENPLVVIDRLYDSIQWDVEAVEDEDEEVEDDSLLADSINAMPFTGTARYIGNELIKWSDRCEYIIKGCLYRFEEGHFLDPDIRKELDMTWSVETMAAQGFQIICFR